MSTSPIPKQVYGYLIDPQSRSITRADYNGLESLYKIIGCELVEAAYFNDERDAAFVDEEGLMKPQAHFFYVDGGSAPLAGRGVVLGCDRHGNTIGPTVTLDWLRDHVAFIERSEFGLIVEAPITMVDKVREFFATAH